MALLPLLASYSPAQGLFLPALPPPASEKAEAYSLPQTFWDPSAHTGVGKEGSVSPSPGTFQTPRGHIVRRYLPRELEARQNAWT